MRLITYLYIILHLTIINVRSLTIIYSEEISHKTLKVLVNDITLGCIDPIEAKNDYEFWLLRAFYSGLMKNDGYGEINRDASIIFNMNYNKKSLSIKLNPNHKWSNGAHITAYDYLYSWNRLKQSSNKLIIDKISSLNLKKICNTKFSFIKSYLLWEKMVDIEVLSKFEIRLNFQSPMDCKQVMGILSHPLFYPVHKETIKNLNNINLQSDKIKIVTNGIYTPLIIKPSLLINAIPNIHNNDVLKDNTQKRQKLEIVTKKYIDNDYSKIDIIEHSIISENDLLNNKILDNDSFKLIENYSTKYLYFTVDLYNIDILYRKNLAKTIYFNLNRNNVKLFNENNYSREQAGFFIKTNKYSPLVPKDIVSNSEHSILIRSGNLVKNCIKNSDLNKLDIYIVTSKYFIYKDWFLKAFNNLNKHNEVNINIVDDISKINNLENSKCIVLNLKELTFNTKDVEEQNSFYIDFYLNTLKHENLRISKIYDIIKLYHLYLYTEDKVNELKNFESILLEDLPCIPFMQASKLFLIKPNIKISKIYDTYGYPIWKHIYDINLDNRDKSNTDDIKSNSLIGYIKKKFGW